MDSRGAKTIRGGFLGLRKELEEDQVTCRHTNWHVNQITRSEISFMTSGTKN
jgi:hypothetical protein